MYCKHCGTRNSGRARNCQRCAAPLTPVRGAGEAPTSGEAYVVWLDKAGPNKVKVIRTICAIADLHPPQAFELVNKAPVVVRTVAGKEAAFEVADSLKSLGAAVRVLPRGKGGAIDSGAGGASRAVGGAHRVLLLDVGSSRISVLNRVRNLCGVGMRDAIALLDGAPSVLADGVDADRAEELRDALQKVGARVEVRTR